jgi:hypothetical protein
MNVHYLLFLFWGGNLPPDGGSPLLDSETAGKRYCFRKKQKQYRSVFRVANKHVT